MKEIRFEWDQWNVQKNESKHGISPLEAESVFFDPGHVLFRDEKHSDLEQRYILYGVSCRHHVLTVVFTYRQEKVRIISARKASRKERSVYEKKKD
jgi:hypothetical protein